MFEFSTLRLLKLGKARRCTAYGRDAALVALTSRNVPTWELAHSSRTRAIGRVDTKLKLGHATRSFAIRFDKRTWSAAGTVESVSTTNWRFDADGSAKGDRSVASGPVCECLTQNQSFTCTDTPDGSYNLAGPSQLVRGRYSIRPLQ
ncbi:hypothetical protein NUW54_g13736 [Trametes sanguinea]|uniref:Uncharacterized protein n=1 Tax=Trametes sanguinea TaxID=158606 RepID=A0ACC1MK17_9APHY|nr:hypothetical protein NUW54_g13736 [Trametes sanguinea]